MVLFWSVVGCGGRGDAAEVPAFEPVGVTFQADHLGVVDEPVDHRGGDYFVAEGLAPPNWNWLRFLIARLPFEVRNCVAGVSA